jgi:hypothetical protein
MVVIRVSWEKENAIYVGRDKNGTWLNRKEEDNMTKKSTLTGI